MVLHLRGCGRVARRRLHCWIGSRSSPCGGSRDPFRISGGPVPGFRSGSRPGPCGGPGFLPPSPGGSPPRSPFSLVLSSGPGCASRSGSFRVSVGSVPGVPRISRGASPGSPLFPFRLQAPGGVTPPGAFHISGGRPRSGATAHPAPRGGGAGPYPGHSDRGPGSADPDAAPHARGSYFRPSPIRRPSPDVPFPYAFRTFRALRPPSGNATTSNRLMLNRLMTVMLDISPV